jgi:hypothetical protein
LNRQGGALNAGLLRRRVIVDGQEGKVYDVLDGQEGKSYDIIMNPRFAANDTVEYVARTGKKYYRVTQIAQ